MSAVKYKPELFSEKQNEHQRFCSQCNAVFAPAYGNKRRVFCSPRCAASFGAGGGGTNAQRAKRLGAKREYFNEARIFERDKWRCQLCGIKTPKSLKGKHQSNSPELDHILPLSVGGDHTWDNCQCACRRCNLAKSNKPLGQQRLMLGTPHWRDKRNVIAYMAGLSVSSRI